MYFVHLPYLPQMISNYIYGAHAVIFCYDITNKDSFEDLEDWLRLVKKSFGQAKLPLCILLGNKSDLEHIRAVKSNAIEKFALENEFIEMLVSAKTGDNVVSTTTGSGSLVLCNIQVVVLASAGSASVRSRQLNIQHPSLPVHSHIPTHGFALEYTRWFPFTR